MLWAAIDRQVDGPEGIKGKVIGLLMIGSVTHQTIIHHPQNYQALHFFVAFRYPIKMQFKFIAVFALLGLATAASSKDGLKKRANGVRFFPPTWLENKNGWEC